MHNSTSMGQSYFHLNRISAKFGACFEAQIGYCGSPSVVPSKTKAKTDTKTKTKKPLFYLDYIFNNVLIFNTVQILVYCCWPEEPKVWLPHNVYTQNQILKY